MKGPFALSTVLPGLKGALMLQDVHSAGHAESGHAACGPGSAQDQAKAPGEASRRCFPLPI